MELSGSGHVTTPVSSVWVCSVLQLVTLQPAQSVICCHITTTPPHIPIRLRRVIRARPAMFSDRPPDMENNQENLHAGWWWFHPQRRRESLTVAACSLVISQWNVLPVWSGIFPVLPSLPIIGFNVRYLHPTNYWVGFKSINWFSNRNCNGNYNIGIFPSRHSKN